jgi:bacillopeptidase F
MSLLLILLNILPQLPFDGKLTSELEAYIKSASAGEKIPVIVHLREQYPYEEIQHLTRQEKIEIFEQVAQQCQEPFINYLQQFPDQVENITQFWIFNGFHMKATRDIIKEIADRNDIWYISHKPEIVIPPVEKGEEIAARAADWNIQRVMAPSCWNAGYTGEDVLIGHIYTGMDTSLPALQGNFSGWWKDFDHGLPEPYDSSGYGTFEIGIICGGDGLGPFSSDIGVAPDARMVVAKATSIEKIDSAMQWMADLKVDSGVDIRAVVCSWGSSNTTELHWWNACNIWKSLNILPVFAIGNFGPNPGLAGTPGNYPLCIGIGATDNVDDIASFSSRGPAPNQSPWNETGNWYRNDWNLTKPDISAPGVNVRSCWIDGTYPIMAGTSIANAHIGGAAAILYQRDSTLTPEELYNILLENADHPSQGEPYPNNNYGWGRLNVWKALQSILGVKEQETYIVKKDFLFPTIINGPLHLPQNQEVRVFDISGREVEPPYLAPGVYFIENDKKIIQKIIIIK